MQPDRERFTAAVRALDAERRTEFVAALWRARGRTVERVGPCELRLDDGRTLATRPGVVAEPDLVVALDGRASGPGVVDAARLHEIATYAVDRATLAELSERFFGRSLAALADADGGRWPRRSLSVGVDGVVALLAVAGVALVVAAAVGMGGGVGGGSDGGGPAVLATPTLTPAPTLTDEPAVPRDLPPGVSPDGDIDEAALAAAHYGVLEGSSYRLTFTYRESVRGVPRVEGSATGIRRETVLVEGDRYAAWVTETGRFHEQPPSLVAYDSYANATTVVERTDDGLVVRDRRNSRPFLEAQARLLDRYLSVESSSVTGTTTVDGEAVVWLTTTGDPWPGVANATGRALVGRDGLVHELRRRYDDPDDPGVNVVVTLRVDRVGTTTVEPPDWYVAANASDG